MGWARFVCFALIVSGVLSSSLVAQEQVGRLEQPLRDDRASTANFDHTWRSATAPSTGLNAKSSSFSEQFGEPLANRRFSWFDELTFFAGIDGSKQPQDFGVNAHLGGQTSMNWDIPLVSDWGLGMQLGTGVTASANAVQVFDLLGETRGRVQSFTTVGLFQRRPSGFSWGLAHDFLYQDYFDNFFLTQWRMRGAYLVNGCNEVGMTIAIRGRSDDGLFAGTVPVTLRPIDQGNLFWRRFWQSGAQSTFWIGLCDGHGENNAVTGPAPRRDQQFLFGADVLMPLTDSLAIYGEANMIMPADTGTVDAFLGIQWYPGRRSYQARRGRYSPVLPLAAPTSFSVDLLQ